MKKRGSAYAYFLLLILIFFCCSSVEAAHLEPYLIWPTENITVNESQTFSFSAGVRCVADENGSICLNVTATLDPYLDPTLESVQGENRIEIEIEKTQLSYYNSYRDYDNYIVNKKDKENKKDRGKNEKNRKEAEEKN